MCACVVRCAGLPLFEEAAARSFEEFCSHWKENHRILVQRRMLWQASQQATRRIDEARKGKSPVTTKPKPAGPGGRYSGGHPDRAGTDDGDIVSGSEDEADNEDAKSEDNHFIVRRRPADAQVSRFATLFKVA